MLGLWAFHTQRMEVWKDLYPSALQTLHNAHFSD